MSWPPLGVSQKDFQVLIKTSLYLEEQIIDRGETTGSILLVGQYFGRITMADVKALFHLVFARETEIGVHLEIGLEYQHHPTAVLIQWRPMKKENPDGNHSN